jgi:hypothetical protein
MDDVFGKFVEDEEAPFIRLEYVGVEGDDLVLKFETDSSADYEYSTNLTEEIVKFVRRTADDAEEDEKLTAKFAEEYIVPLKKLAHTIKERSR